MALSKMPKKQREKAVKRIREELRSLNSRPVPRDVGASPFPGRYHMESGFSGGTTVKIHQDEPSVNDKVQDLIDFVEERIGAQGCLTTPDARVVHKALVNIQNHLESTND